MKKKLITACRNFFVNSNIRDDINGCVWLLSILIIVNNLTTFSMY